jgi:heterodisulfide reductase subunit B
MKGIAWIAKECGKKHRHKSKGAAEAHLRSMVKIEKDEGITVYPCPYCHFWHIGHTPKRKRRYDK